MTRRWPAALPPASDDHVSATETDDPLYAVTRGIEGDVIVRLSEMTDAEREQGWRDYERAFGTAAEKVEK